MFIRLNKILILFLIKYVNVSSIFNNLVVINWLIKKLLKLIIFTIICLVKY